MSRKCGIPKVDTPVNPCYLDSWYGAVSVKEVIDNAFNAAWNRAELLASRYGTVSIWTEPWQNVSAEMERYLNLKLRCLDILTSNHTRAYESSITMNDPWGRNIEIVQAAFHNGLKSKNKIDIPTHWNDSELDWTWTDVCNHGEYYSSSSTEVWPRPEYARKALFERRLSGLSN